MSEGGGQPPIDDTDTPLPWAEFDAAPSAETPAIGEEAAPAGIAVGDEADESDLVPLQLDDAPDEEVTLVLTRDDAASIEPEESIISNVVEPAAVVEVLPEPVELPISEPPVEVAVSVSDAVPVETTLDAIPAVEIPAVPEASIEAIEALDISEPVAVVAEPIEASIKPVIISKMVPIAEPFEAPASPALLSTDAPIAADIVSDVTVQNTSISLEPVLSESTPVVDFFEHGEFEALHAPMEIVEPIASAEPIVVVVAPIVAATQEALAVEEPAVIALTSSETNDDFDILTPQPVTPMEQIAPPSPTAVNVVAESEDANDEPEPDPEPVPEEEAELELVSAGAPVDEGGAGAWSIAAMCLGVAIIACAVLIPQTDFNRRLVYEREKLRRDLASIEQQVKVNDEFLQRVSSDPSLAERLAQRQMKIIRKGTRVLELQNDPPEEMSPYQLVAVPPPAPLPAYEPKKGMIASACYGVRSRLYLMGAGLMLMAAGLVFGAGPTRE